MNDHIKSATEYAFTNKVSDMQAEIESALQYKIANALEAQKIEVAKSLMSDGVSEDCGCDKKLKGDQDKLDVAEPKGKLTAADFKKLRKEDENIEEKLTGDMPASKVIQDFVHSDNPKFKGKSKKERVKMALGAFYGMHKESIEESKPSAGLSTKEKSEVVKKAKKGEDIGKSGKGFKKIAAAAKKSGARDPEAVAAAAMWKNIKR